MPVKSRTKSPTQTITINRLPEAGDEITLRARVTRIGRNGYDTGDTITVRIPGYPAPVTINATTVLYPSSSNVSPGSSGARPAKRTRRR